MQQKKKKMNQNDTEQIFEILSDEVRNTTLEVPEQPVLYNHHISFGISSVYNYDLFKTTFRRFMSLTPGIIFEEVDNFIYDTSSEKYISKDWIWDITEKQWKYKKYVPNSDEFNSNDIKFLFEFRRPSYMQWFWFLKLIDTLVKSSIASFVSFYTIDNLTSGKKSFNKKVEDLTVRDGCYHLGDYKKHIRREMGAYNWDVRLNDAILRKATRNKRIVRKNTEIFKNLHYTDSPFCGREYQFSIQDMRQMKSPGSAVRNSTNNFSIPSPKHLNIIKGCIFDTSDEIGYAVMVDDDREEYMRYAFSVVKKTGCWVSEFYNMVNRIIEKDEKKIMRERLHMWNKKLKK